MTLLYPLGLLGLIGLIVLIIIYIIKPNYQQKFVSTTFVWKLSLKYRKKRIPISKLRNILLIICQVLILSICAMILTQPSEILKSKETRTEVIAIVDSSASMRTQTDDVTRFSRALEQAKELVTSTVNKGGIASLIIADMKAEVLVERITASSLDSLAEALEPYYEADLCSYGESNIDAAIALTEDIVRENPAAQIYVYTDIVYEEKSIPKGIKVVPMALEEEWNAGILDARAVLDDGYYTFYVDVATYVQARNVEVRIDVQGANAYDSNSDGVNVILSENVFCEPGVTKTVVFIYEGIYEANENESDDVIFSIVPEADKIFAYQEVYISISENDSFYEDNNFNIYNGQKELLQIQYVSAQPNVFFPSMLATLKAAFADRWDIKVTEPKRGGEYAMEGFDIYVFEHQMPESMPKDGVVFLANPEMELGSAPTGSGIQLKGTTPLNRDVFFVNEAEDHPMMKNVDANNISAQQIVSANYDASYQALMYCANIPSLLVKNEPSEKVVVMPFSLHYSNLALLKEFPILLYNMIEYFFPVTVNGNAFEVYENVSVNARGEELYVSRGSETLHTFTEFPSILKVDLPGEYILTQTTFTGKNVSESIFVKIPSAESDIAKFVESLPNPFIEEVKEDYFRDLLLYFAAALVAIQFLEWFLQSRDNM
jgi:hypothetical protein